MKTLKYLFFIAIICLVSSCKNHSAVIDGSKITIQGDANQYLYVLPEKYMIQQINDANIYISVLLNINKTINPDSCMVLCWNPIMQLQNSKGQNISNGALVFAKSDQFPLFYEYIKKPVSSQQYFTFANFELPNDERRTIFENTTQAIIEGIDILVLGNPIQWDVVISKYGEYVNTLYHLLVISDKEDALKMRNVQQLINVVHMLRNKVDVAISSNQLSVDQLEQVNAINLTLQQCVNKAQELNPVIVI